MNKNSYLLCLNLFIFLIAKTHGGFSSFDKNLHYERLLLLKTKGFEPKVIYDIGAFKGYWSLEMQSIFPDAEFILFEANENNQPFLRQTQLPYYLALLGDKEGIVTFYTNNSTGDSIYKEQTRYYQDQQCSQQHIAMTTLTNLVSEYTIPLPDLIKLDVQGAEKLILQGGISVILNAEVMILETKILEYNQKAPLVYEIISFMDALGYSLQDLLECHYLPTGELNEIDFLFMKKDSTLIRKGLLI